MAGLPKFTKSWKQGAGGDVRKDNAANRGGSACGYLRIAGAGLGFRGEQFRVSSSSFALSPQGLQRNWKLETLDQMKVLVIASSRRIRRQLIEQARVEGHEVTTLEGKLSRFHWRRPKHRVVPGDVLNERSLPTAVAGQDAVLCWLTQKSTRQPTTYLWEGTANLIRTMERHGVRRLICVSACGAGDSRGHCGFFYDKIVQPLFWKHVFEDRDRQEELIRGTQLEWVIVRPARLSNGRSRGEYMVLTDLRNFRARRIALADAVEFALKQLRNNFYVFQTPVVTY